MNGKAEVLMVELHVGKLGSRRNGCHCESKRSESVVAQGDERNRAESLQWQ